MVTAYILVAVGAGKEKKIADSLKKVQGVEEVDLIYGDYDIIVKIHVPDIAGLGDFIIEHIRAIKGVEKTSTLIAVSGE